MITLRKALVFQVNAARTAKKNLFFRFIKSTVTSSEMKPLVMEKKNRSRTNVKIAGYKHRKIKGDHVAASRYLIKHQPGFYHSPASKVTPSANNLLQ